MRWSQTKKWAAHVNVGDAVVNAIDGREPLIKYAGKWVTYETDDIEEMLIFLSEHSPEAAQEFAEKAI